MCVSGGYPGDYEKGVAIQGLDKPSDSLVFHAGTAIKGKETVTSGGRVLAVTSFGKSISEAAEKSFETIDKIEYAGKYFRNDIGKDLTNL